MLSPQINREVALNSDRKAIYTAPVGTIEIIPAGSELFARWNEQKENILVAVNPSCLAKLAQLEFDIDSFELIPPSLGNVDKKALWLGDALKEETLKNGANSLCIESLSNLFFMHMLRNYSSIAIKSSKNFKGGLKTATLKKIREYVEENCSQAIKIEELAAIARLSTSHFNRAFRENTQQSPLQYIIGVRLANAHKLIVETKLSLGSIAAATGFASASHLNNTMQKIWHIKPSELRPKKRIK